MTYYTNRHSCYLLQYHLVLVTKYRHPVIKGKQEQFLKEYTQQYFNIVKLILKNKKVKYCMNQFELNNNELFYHSFQTDQLQQVPFQLKKDIQVLFFRITFVLVVP